MKILMLCEFFDETLEYQENLLVKYYRKYGHEVTVITSTLDSVFDYYSDKHDVKKPTREYRFNGARIIKLQYKSIWLWNRLRTFKDITPFLEEEKPDLIFVHCIMLNLPQVIRYIKKNPRCRMIMDYHADYSNSARNWMSLKILHGTIRRRFYLDPARKYLSKIFPVVPAGFVFLNEVYKVSFDEMELLPLGGDCDLARMTAEGVNKSALRESLNIRDEDFVIFTGGKLEKRKKTELLLNAVRQLGNPRIHVVIVGKADSEEFHRSLIESSGEQENFHFLGWLKNEEIYRYMAISDIAVFPASQSILWQQAICMHLPLVVGNTGGQSIEYLNLHSNIITLSKDEICESAIGKVIIELFENDAKRASMADGAEKSAKELLDWNQLIHKTLRFNES